MKNNFMKQIVCFLLSFFLVGINSIPVFAETSKEEYYSVGVEFSDKKGKKETIQIMVKDGHVYGNAEHIGTRLGYEVKDVNNSHVVIENKDNKNLPYGATYFYYNDTKVNHVLFLQMNSNYKAPCPTLKNSKGIWIPLEYAFIILNSGMTIIDDTLLIDMPEKDIIDVHVDIMKNSGTYPFDWNKDFGYTDSQQLGLTISNHYVNVFNEILGLDGTAWLELLQSVTLLDSYAYEKKYGKELSLLICTVSNKELAKITEEVEMLQDLLGGDGKLNGLLKKYSMSLNNSVEALTQANDRILNEVKAGNTSIATYNRSYRALENALDKQTWFSNTGEMLMDAQKTVSKEIPNVEFALKIAEFVKYGSEFTNQDTFSVEALKEYLNSSAGSLSADTVKQGMQEQVGDLETNVARYSGGKFIENNISSWIVEGLGIEKALGNQANMVLMCWSLVSNYVPFISEKIEGADKFELAMYSMVLQSDTMEAYNKQRNQFLDNKIELTPENLYNLSKKGYLYLKTCYITREAALGSLEGKVDSSKIQSLLDYQNGINDELAEQLVKLKNAKPSNEDNIYGFLPTDNEKYLNEYDSSKLLECCKKNDDSQIFKSLPESFTFASGVGGWYTEIKMADDGSFKGHYGNSDLGDTGNNYPYGTYYYCDFKGKFSAPQKINEYKYVMRLEYITIDKQPGTVHYEDGKRYFATSEPYGIENNGDYYLYLPGTPVSMMEEEFIGWTSAAYSMNMTNKLPSGWFGIYNVNGGASFVGNIND